MADRRMLIKSLVTGRVRLHDARCMRMSLGDLEDAVAEVRAAAADAIAEAIRDREVDRLADPELSELTEQELAAIGDAAAEAEADSIVTRLFKRARR